MSGISLYETSNELREILADIDQGGEDGEIPADVEKRLDAIAGTFSDKIDGVLRFRAGLVASVEGIDVELRRLQALRDQYAKKEAWLKQYVFTCMLMTGHRKLDTRLHKLAVCRNSRPSIRLAEGAAIPELLVKPPAPPPPPELDNAKCLEIWKAWRAATEAAELCDHKAKAAHTDDERVALEESADAYRSQAEANALPPEVHVIDGCHLRIR